MTEIGERRVVVVTGLSGAGKASTMRILEDLGFEAVDNAPLSMLEPLAQRGRDKLAIGIDARTDGFDASAVIAAVGRLRMEGLRVELIFLTAEDATLIRRFTATRRRHPLAPSGPVIDGIEAERRSTAPLREAADLLLDTTGWPLHGLRREVEDRLAPQSGCRIALTLMSFAFPEGLPLEADMVFDARFLQNPHYDPQLRDKTGIDEAVARHVRQDADYVAFIETIERLLRLVLPRFVCEGKRYATVAIGCTGGRHRSVALIEDLARRMRASFLGEQGIRMTVLHRGLESAKAPPRPSPERLTADR